MQAKMVIKTIIVSLVIFVANQLKEASEGHKITNAQARLVSVINWTSRRWRKL